MRLCFQWGFFHSGVPWLGIQLPKHWSRLVKSQCNIATTLFSSANPANVLKNIAYAEKPIDWDLVKEVQEIIGDQMCVSWANS